jgi:hypothetical protein
MKNCKVCSNLLPESRFYYLGYFKKKSGEKAFSSYCKKCNSERVNKNKSPKQYKPRRTKQAIREEILVDSISIYHLVKRIEYNNYKVDYIDCFRIVSLYIDLYGDDLGEYFCEREQLEIMIFKLKQHILGLGPQVAVSC